MSNPVINEHGDIHWHNEVEELHRLDGPTLEVGYWGRTWRNENGEFHRLDGPAVEMTSGHKQWWIDGRRYVEEEFYKEIERLKNEQSSN